VVLSVLRSVADVSDLAFHARCVCVLQCVAECALRSVMDILLFYAVFVCVCCSAMQSVLLCVGECALQSVTEILLFTLGVCVSVAVQSRVCCSVLQSVLECTL